MPNKKKERKKKTAKTALKMIYEAICCLFDVFELTHKQLRNRCMTARDRTGDQWKRAMCVDVCLSSCHCPGQSTRSLRDAPN